ncbi:DUF3450 family protein [Alteromonas gracilis]|uniref:DUF3450 family protein n=1 Tax=Alteromonas gracilis TaxID=1479524 RepID=UPI0037351C15
MIVKRHLALSILLVLITVLSCSNVLAKTKASDIDTLTEKWINIERQTQKLENEWRESEPALRQRIQLLKAERTQLQSMFAESKAAANSVENQREALLSKQSELEAQQGGVKRKLMGVIGQVDSLYSSLPEIIRQTWDKEHAELDADADTSNKLQVTLAKLSSLAQFNSKLLVNETVMRAPDDQDVLVKQFFVGSSYAWFTNADGQYQGIGRVQNGEWQWQFNESVNSEAIALAISIFEKKHEPDFVSLPLTLAQGESE